MFLRRISLLSNYHKSLYSTKTGSAIKEILKIIDPSSKIKIQSSIGIEIRPYDLLDCPNSNLLRARISSQSSEFDKVDFNISVNDKIVEISNHYKGDAVKKDVLCVLEVPVKSDLDIVSTDSVRVSEMYSDYIRVKSDKTVRTKNIRSTSIDLSSTNGDVICDGLILAHKMDIHTQNRGNIRLDKLQGDLIHCKTFDGNIETKSCYVETSKFVTETGKLLLNNMHKTSEIYVLKSGVIDMTGIHGNVYIKSNGGDLKLQFSEISGDNIIMATDSNNVTINISDAIEQNSFIEIHSDKIVLNDSVSHLADCLSDETSFRMGREESSSSKLLICVNGTLTLGKMSWADSMKQLMGMTDV